MESARPLQTARSKAPAVGPVLDLPEAGEFSVVFLPDTQYYSARYPELFRGQTRWIADNRMRFNIQAVLHDPQFNATQVVGRGYDVAGLGPREFARYIAEEMVSRAELVRVSGAKLD